MRADLRQSCSEIWVVDCSPDGHQPEVATRIFPGVQQPVCIVIAAKSLGKAENVPARVRFHALAVGRQEEKFAALATLSLDAGPWVDCPSGWREPFLPAATGAWADFPRLKDLFVYDGSGVMPGRTWVIAPDRESLSRRWQRLVAEKDEEKRDLLFHPHEGGDKTTSKKAKAGLAGHEYRSIAIEGDRGAFVEPARYAFRSFDRQWIIPDSRLINRPNRALWNGHSERQVYLTALEAHSPTSGPAITFAGFIPDLHHYKGSFGGRARPLWRDQAASQPNVRPELIALLAEAYGQPVTPEDVMAYCAALMAHPAFTARFSRDLIQPGLRIPLTADAALFREAADLGKQVIWLHCYGERFYDSAAGRPKAPPRLPADAAPVIPSGGAIPPAPEPLPDAMDYDPATRRLKIGKGYVDNVSPEMWAYEVSGKQVLWQWFSYRKRDRTKPVIGDKRPPSPLDAIQPEGWLAEYTVDLMNLLHVLGRLIRLEPAQADLLQKILDHRLIPVENLTADAEGGDSAR